MLAFIHKKKYSSFLVQVSWFKEGATLSISPLFTLPTRWNLAYFWSHFPRVLLLLLDNNVGGAYHIRLLFNTSTGTVSNHIYIYWIDAGVAVGLLWMLLILLLSVSVGVNFGVDVALMAMWQYDRITLFVPDHTTECIIIILREWLVCYFIGVVYMSCCCCISAIYPIPNSVETSPLPTSST